MIVKTLLCIIPLFLVAANKPADFSRQAFRVKEVQDWPASSSLQQTGRANAKPRAEGIPTIQLKEAEKNYNDKLGQLSLKITTIQIQHHQAIKANDSKRAAVHRARLRQFENAQYDHIAYASGFPSRELAKQLVANRRRDSDAIRAEARRVAIEIVKRFRRIDVMEFRAAQLELRDVSFGQVGVTVAPANSSTFVELEFAIDRTSFRLVNVSLSASSRPDDPAPDDLKQWIEISRESFASLLGEELRDNPTANTIARTSFVSWPRIWNNVELSFRFTPSFYAHQSDGRLTINWSVPYPLAQRQAAMRVLEQYRVAFDARHAAQLVVKCAERLKKDAHVQVTMSLVSSQFSQWREHRKWFYQDELLIQQIAKEGPFTPRWFVTVTPYEDSPLNSVVAEVDPASGKLLRMGTHRLPW